MKKYLTIILTLIASVLLVFTFDNKTIDAATSNGVNYSISPELPSNQISKNIGYYDLKVTPGQKETIKFKINNSDSKDHTYKVSVNRAATDINGVIDYNDHGIAPDSDLQYNIEKLNTQLNHLKSINEFIQSVLSNKIDLKKDNKNTLIKFCNDNEIIVKKQGSYDYLFNISILNFTPSKVSDLQKAINSVEKEIVTLGKKSAKDLWIKDLDDFLDEIRSGF